MELDLIEIFWSKLPPILVALFSGLLDWIIPIRDLVLKISCPPDYAVVKVRGSARGCSGGSRGGAQGVQAPPSIWRSGSATGLLRMVHESVHTKMLKFVFLPSVSCGSAFCGQIWLFYASCWISLKNECLRGYDSCALKSGIIYLLQCSYISNI